MAFKEQRMAGEKNLTGGEWRVISDTVMGGRSSGSAVATPCGINFAGELSLANNGGFSSARTSVSGCPASAVALRLHVRGDGRRYQVRLRQDRAFDGVSWRAFLDTSGDWQTVELPFGAFEPVFRGRRVPGAGPLQAARISQLGLLLADGVSGPFRLEVQRMAFVARDE